MRAACARSNPDFCVPLVLKARRKKITFLHPEPTRLKFDYTAYCVTTTNLTITTVTTSLVLAKLAIALNKVSSDPSPTDLP